jgi:hypothetical protein
MIEAFLHQPISLMLLSSVPNLIPSPLNPILLHPIHRPTYYSRAPALIGLLISPPRHTCDPALLITPLALRSRPHCELRMRSHSPMVLFLGAIEFIDVLMTPGAMK